MTERVIAVIPAYNEGESVGEVVKSTRRHVDEVLVVDDGSTDDTAEIAQHNGATVLRHAINTGVGGAQRTGYRYAIQHDFDFVVQIDADGQHDREYIGIMLEAALDNDMVIGSRYLNESFEDYHWVRRIGIKFFTWVVNVLGGVDITDVTSGFRVYRVDRLQEIIYRSDKHWAVEQTLEAAKRGLDIEEVSVEMPLRQTGESQFSINTFVFYPLHMLDDIIRVIIFR